MTMYTNHQPIQNINKANKKALEYLAKGDANSAYKILARLEMLLDKAASTVKYTALHNKIKIFAHKKISNIDLLRANIYNSIACVNLKYSAYKAVTVC